MTCLILVIGNELLNGEVPEANSTFLQRECSHYAVAVQRVCVLPDDPAIIQAEIHKGISDYSNIFITGGLGPTEDDVTREAVAKALKRKLVMIRGEKAVLKKKFKASGRPMSPNNLKQAYFPERARVLPNPIGAASGFLLKEKGCRLFVLPGVPSEMRRIFRDEVIAILNKALPRNQKFRKLLVKTLGEGESLLDEKIKRYIAPHHSVRWEIVARGQGVFIKFYPINQVESWEEGLKEGLRERLGPLIYAFDDEDMGGIIENLLSKKNYRLGCVESCTGGYISKYLTDRPGSSEYFSGGMVTYSNTLKTRLAGVDKRLIQRHGAVSAKVAEAMAQGGKKRLGSDLCLSVTGIAGPGGGSGDKPVGTVWFGVIDQKARLVVKRRVFSGGRELVRQKSVFYALNLVRLMLQDRMDFIEDNL